MRFILPITSKFKFKFELAILYIIFNMTTTNLNKMIIYNKKNEACRCYCDKKNLYGCIIFSCLPPFPSIISHYNPSDMIIDLVSHTTYVVCVNFIRKWRDLQFKVYSDRQIFWETFHNNFIYLVFARNLLRKSPKKYFLYFVFMPNSTY